MAKIAVVTDSTTYLPKELTKEFDIQVVPSVVIMGGEELRDGFDIQPTEFYKRLATIKENPTTSQPTPAAFKAKFDELASKGFTDVLGVFISRSLSGTIASAEAAKEQVSGVNVAIVESQSVSMGAGWQVLEGAKAAKAGKSLAECVKAVENARANTGVIFLVDTLEFLHRGGRIGGAQRFMGTALNLKPILEVVEGKLDAVERVRTKAKALDRLVELLAGRIAARTPVRLAVMHANALEDAKALLEAGSKRVQPIETALSDISPAVGTHTGPGTLGFAFMAGVN